MLTQVILFYDNLELFLYSQIIMYILTGISLLITIKLNK